MGDDNGTLSTNEKEKSNNGCFPKEKSKDPIVVPPGCLHWSSVSIRTLKKKALRPVKECVSSRAYRNLLLRRGGQAGRRQRLPSSMTFILAAMRGCGPGLGRGF